MNNTREKLIELMQKPIEIMPGRMFSPTISFKMPYAVAVADHLIANGVTIQTKRPQTDLPKITDQTMDAIKKIGEQSHGGE